MAKNATILTSITINVKDLLDELDEEDHTRIVREFGNCVGSIGVVISAINRLRLGDINDGIAMLERELLPKWSDKTECAMAYQQAIALTRASA